MKLPDRIPTIDARPRPPELFDVHVHPWPPKLYAAMLRWFDTHAWTIDQRVDAGGVDAFLAERGVGRYVALVYAHKPGLAREINRWLSTYARAHPTCVPMGTVHPDDDVHAVLDEAFGELGLTGLKLHAHVMGIAPDNRRLWPVYERLCALDRPLVFHAGTEPASDAYPMPCDQVSGLAKLETVLRDFPTLRCVIPHLGAGEFERAGGLLARYPGVMLDTAMTLARYFAFEPGRAWVLEHHRRIMYGTDFPILPYDYDRERTCIQALELGAEVERAIFWSNAMAFYRPG